MEQQAAVRTSLTGTALVRLLEGLTDPRKRVRDSRAAFADGLVQWTGWADAIALSAALDRPPAVAALPVASDGSAAGERAECERVRAALTQTTVREVGGTGRSPMEMNMGYTPFRQRYLARQQAMDVAVGALRERVRGVVAAATPELARLAAVDAVMAQVLGGPERRLLATVPTLLDKHYQRLRDAHQGDAGQGGDAPVPEWLDGFRRDLLAVLAAELDLRLQPVEGLIEALEHATNPV